MFKWHRLPDESKKNILTEAANEKGYPTNVIEKDWWVTLALRAVFNTAWAENLVFKGGTSLSKSYDIINRFSEDVDLAMDKTVLGFSAEKELSNSQVRKLREKGAAFIENEFVRALRQNILDLNIDPNSFSVSIKAVEQKDLDPRIVMLNYNSIIGPAEYLQDRVLIEIGVRSLMEPCDPRPISSFISQLYPNQSFADPVYNINTVNPRRTFLEKVFLLHEEFLKPVDKRRHERMSRHLYDLHCLMDNEFGQAALKDKELFNLIVGHREKYTAIRGITYTNHTYGGLNFIPPVDDQVLWKNDYEQMVDTMIYGKPPSWGELIFRMEELKNRFRNLM